MMKMPEFSGQCCDLLAFIKFIKFFSVSSDLYSTKVFDKEFLTSAVASMP